jgi:type II secretory pathway pseudopilin PulG
MEHLRNLYTVRDVEGMLEQAISLARSGEKEEARELLERIVETDRDNELAWQWLALCAASRDDRIRALEQVVAINPTNTKARRVLAQMQESPWHTLRLLLEEIRYHRYTRPVAIGVVAVLALALTLSLGLRIYRSMYRRHLESAVINSEARKLEAMQTATARAWFVPTWTPAPTRTPSPTNTLVVPQEPSTSMEDSGAVSWVISIPNHSAAPNNPPPVSPTPRGAIPPGHPTPLPGLSGWSANARP